MDDKAFRFEYNIFGKVPFDRYNFTYEEYFIPYNKEELIDSPLQELMGYEFNRLFENENNFKYQQEYDFLHSVSENEILPDTINILMDAVYCVNIGLINNELIPAYKQKHLISQLITLKKIQSNPNIIIKSPINYIAIYTELIKAEVNEIKYFLSALFHLYNSTDDIDKNLANNFLQRIKKKFNIKYENFTIDNKKIIKDVLLSFFNYANFQNSSNKQSMVINFNNLNRFIKLLKNYKESQVFFYQSNCFCLIQEGKKYYFSFSGYKHHKDGSFYDDDDLEYENLGTTIKNKLNSFFSNKKDMFTFCRRTDSMLSYGEFCEKKFVNFPSPISFAEQKGLVAKKKLPDQYRCCERKIFPYIKNKSESMNIYCKYEPCIRCMPAIEEKKKLYANNFAYFAFIKDYKTFAECIKKQNFFFTKTDLVHSYLYKYR